jgi:hypothetical protein
MTSDSARLPPEADPAPLSRDGIERELDALRAREAELQRRLESRSEETDWRQGGYYWTYHATTGALLGMLAASTSLVANVVGAAALHGDPLRLIRVYLTFGLGEQALDARGESGLVLALGCCLYLGTGMLLGIPFHIALTRLARGASLLGRLLVASALAVGLWLATYYGLLAWLQPLLFGGRYIVDSVPVWVAALTHLVFGWTMAVIYPWGLFEPYHVRSIER